jgi:phosphinothricin acetyltransferase
VEVRDAIELDLPAIVDIYNAWIPTRTITWTETLDTLEARAAWFARQNAEGWPVLVADVAGTVAGFTCYEPFRGEGKWPGYRTTAELSIHVQESHWGRGVGRALVEALIERGRAAGLHVLVAGIDSDNLESIRFHERLGFVEVGRMPEIGQKFGHWLDLVLMQRVIDDRPAP